MDVVMKGDVVPSPGAGLLVQQVLVDTYVAGVCRGQRPLLVPRSDRTPLRHRAPSFHVGFGPRVDAPVGMEFVPTACHPLVELRNQACVLNLGPGMRGRVLEAGRWRSWEGAAGEAVLAPGSRAEITCGTVVFDVRWEAAAVIVGTVPWRVRLQRLWHVWFAVGALLMFAGLLAAIPPDMHALGVNSDDLFARAVPFLNVPPEINPIKHKSGETALNVTATAKATFDKARTTTGKGGKPSKGGRPRRGDGGGEPVVDPRHAGFLAILSTQRGRYGSLFGDDSGTGIEGALDGVGLALAGDAYQLGGLNIVGPDGHEGETLGLATIGTCGGLKNCEGVRSGTRGEPGALRQRGTRDVVVTPGPDAETRGMLDKEIIRRTIRRHLNEIRHCYESELLRTPDLAGRLAVKFVIAPHGAVSAAAVAHSSLASARVEACVTQAVRRWAFPAPDGGGVTVVTYPFVFTSPGR